MASRQSNQQKPLTIPILLGSVLIGAGAIYASAPGLLLTLIGIIVAAGDVHRTEGQKHRLPVCRSCR